MNQERVAKLRLQATRLYEQGRGWLACLPATVQVMLGLFLLAVILIALYTAMSGKDASLHLKLQHDFRSADIWVSIDGVPAYSGMVVGASRKKLGLIPQSVQGNLSQIIPVASGAHRIRVRVVPENGTAQEDSITGDFSHNAERELLVSAHRNGLSLDWQSANPQAPLPSPGWFGRYAGSILLTIGGSIVSALTGLAVRELPARIRARRSAEPRTHSTAAGQ